MGKLYGKSIQCTVYSVECTMYSKVVFLSLWRERQCSSVWGVTPFARLLLWLTPPEESSQSVYVIGSCRGHGHGVKIGCQDHANEVIFDCLGHPNGLKFGCQGSQMK